MQKLIELIIHHAESEKIQQAITEFLSGDYADQQNITTIIQYLQKNNYFELSISLLKQSIKKYPEQAFYYSLLGDIYLQQKQPELAITHYQHALSLDHQLISAYIGLGLVHHQQKKYNEAIRYYQQVLALAPHLAEINVHLALIYLEQNQIMTAKKLLIAAIKLKPNFYKAYRYLGDIFLGQHKPKTAIYFYEHALQGMEADADLWNNLGVCYLQMQNHKTAYDYFNKALLLDDIHESATSNIAAIYQQQDYYENAARLYRELIAHHPKNEEYIYQLACCELALGDLQQAELHFQEYLSFYPEFLPALLNLAAVFMKQENFNAAIAIYKKINKLDKHNPIAEFTLAALTRNTQYDRATTEYLTALFDQYAWQYDQHLQKVLQYQVPQEMKIILEKFLLDKKLNILDLGCGTGLSGLILAPYAKKLIGVDLSEKMLAFAEKKRIYSQLIHADFLSPDFQCPDKFDLITAADTFVYIGDLQPVFKNCYDWLRPNGYLIFNIETIPFSWFKRKNYQLQKTGRFSHRCGYIKKLLHKQKLKIIFKKKIILRQQKGKPVKGFIFLLQK